MIVKSALTLSGTPVAAVELSRNHHELRLQRRVRLKDGRDILSSGRSYGSSEAMQNCRLGDGEAMRGARTERAATDGHIFQLLDRPAVVNSVEEVGGPVGRRVEIY